MVKGKTALALGFRGDAIGRNRDFEISHVGVIGRIQDADVGGEAGKHETLNLEPLEKNFERCREERRVHRLKNKVVIFVGLEKFDDGSAGPILRDAMFYLLAEVRPPAPEIIVRGTRLRLARPLRVAILREAGKA